MNYDKYNKEEIFYLNSDSPYFQMIGKAINRDISIREEYDRNEHNSKEIKWHILKNIDDNLKVYKDVKKKLDKESFNRLYEVKEDDRN